MKIRTASILVELTDGSMGERVVAVEMYRIRNRFYRQAWPFDNCLFANSTLNQSKAESNLVYSSRRDWQSINQSINRRGKSSSSFLSTSLSSHHVFDAWQVTFAVSREVRNAWRRVSMFRVGLDSRSLRRAAGAKFETTQEIDFAIRKSLREKFYYYNINII